jgi:peptidoglycan/xylan/chitin deacetylase (PgdA/CDA1 family)
MLSPLATGALTAFGAAAGLGLAAGGYAYATLWPGSQLFGSALIAPRRPGEIALTFDDGPNPAWTPRLLDTLAKHNLHAAFFMVGRRAQAEPALVRQIAAAGHIVGNHSWTHANLATASASQIHQEIARASETLTQITGSPIRYFRPPFGARRPETLRVARHLGLTPVLWNAMTSDWESPAVEVITRQLALKIDSLTRHGRAVNLVLHDGGHLEPAAHRASSVAACAQLIERYLPTHRFVTLDSWT